MSTTPTTTPTPSRSFESAGANVQVFPDAATAAIVAAEIFAETIRTAVAARGQAVLGMATGGTPVLVYEQLVKRHKAGELSFVNVTTYNLDEYYPISPFDRNSYSTTSTSRRTVLTSSMARSPRPRSKSTRPILTNGSRPTVDSTSSSWGSGETVTSASTSP